MVRTKEEWKTITISKHMYDILEEDRKHFEKDIGGGKWSMNDALRERQKILNLVKSEKLIGDN